MPNSRREFHHILEFHRNNQDVFNVDDSKNHILAHKEKRINTFYSLSDKLFFCQLDNQKSCNGSNDHNCVLYLRQQRGIKLPSQNLTTYSSKLSIINSSVPREKSVAIIKTPGRNAGIGHLAEVTSLEQKNGKVTMRLSEANNPTRGYYERSITGRNLEDIQKNANIVGYYVEPNETINAQSGPYPRYL